MAVAVAVTVAVTASAADGEADSHVACLVARREELVRFSRSSR